MEVSDLTASPVESLPNCWQKNRISLGLDTMGRFTVLGGIPDRGEQSTKEEESKSEGNQGNSFRKDSSTELVTEV
jgi:hypothetical protein